MTDKELAEETRKALEEFNRLPPDEQIRRMVASGTINIHGEVLMGRESKTNEKQQTPLKSNS